MTIRDNYVLYRTNPDNDEHSLSHFATSFGYTIEEVKNVLRGDKTIEKEILDARRTKYARRMQKIDDALFRSADLLYRRFDGWDPKVVEQTNNFYNFTDIVKGLREDDRQNKSRGRSIPD
jgi:hypothetical protein